MIMQMLTRREVIRSHQPWQLMMKHAMWMAFEHRRFVEGFAAKASMDPVPITMLEAQVEEKSEYDDGENTNAEGSDCDEECDLTCEMSERERERERERDRERERETKRDIHIHVHVHERTYIYLHIKPRIRIHVCSCVWSWAQANTWHVACNVAGAAGKRTSC